VGDCVTPRYQYAVSGDVVWGWVDMDCTELHVFMCRMMGERSLGRGWAWWSQVPAAQDAGLLAGHVTAATFCLLWHLQHREQR
jgi:hypothetical protein